MNLIQKLSAATAFTGVIAAASLGIAADRSAAFGVTGERGSYFEIMSPGNGLSLDIGSKRVIAVLATKNDACELTLVLSNQGDSGARIVVPVLPGNALQVDSVEGKSAEFSCRLAGTTMDARVLDRTPYKS